MPTWLSTGVGHCHCLTWENFPMRNLGHLFCWMPPATAMHLSCTHLNTDKKLSSMTGMTKPQKTWWISSQRHWLAERSCILLLLVLKLLILNQLMGWCCHLLIRSWWCPDKRLKEFGQCCFVFVFSSKKTAATVSTSCCSRQSCLPISCRPAPQRGEADPPVPWRWSRVALASPRRWTKSQNWSLLGSKFWYRIEWTFMKTMMVKIVICIDDDDGNGVADDHDNGNKKIWKFKGFILLFYPLGQNTFWPNSSLCACPADSFSLCPLKINSPQQSDVDTLLTHYAYNIHTSPPVVYFKKPDSHCFHSQQIVL